MKHLLGGPGTLSGFILRMGQCGLAAASLVVMMVSSKGSLANTAFCLLSVSMGFQSLWSLGLACADVFVLKRKIDLRNVVGLFVLGDWATSILSLAAACSSAGVVVLYSKDTTICKDDIHFPCRRFEISVLLAFSAWILVAISSHITFWTLGSV